VAALDDIGFEPEAVSNGRTRQILLHHCPFREAAANNREVVCGVHLGLMQGLLSELNAPITAHQLDALVEPSLCITRLAARDNETVSAFITVQADWGRGSGLGLACANKLAGARIQTS